MNCTASHLANRKQLNRAVEEERFLKAERGGVGRKVLAKNALFQARSGLCGEQNGSTG